MFKIKSLTSAIILINLLIYLSQYIFGVQLYEILGLRNFVSELFKPYQLFTYGFVHLEFKHLLNNMFGLYIFGLTIEQTLGNKNFIRFYIITCIGSALFFNVVNYFILQKNINSINSYIASPSPEKFNYYAKNFSSKGQRNLAKNFTNDFYLNRDNNEFIEYSKKILQKLHLNRVNSPIIGASGVVFGLITAFAFLFPNRKIFILFFIPIKAKFLIILYGIYELYNGINYNLDNIAHFVHIGGIIVGFLFIKWWSRRSDHYV